MLQEWLVVWWNGGGMNSMVGIRNDTMPLRMRIGMHSGMDGIWVVSLDLDVCIYNSLYVDVGENGRAGRTKKYDSI